MMNPSFNVCKTCALQCAVCLPRVVMGADPCSSVIQFDNIRSNHSILFHFGIVQMETIQAGSAFMLMSSDLNHCCIPAYQQ